MPLSRSALCLLLFASLAHADVTVEFTVAAGKHDRKNEPVRVPLQLSAAPTDLAVVEIKEKDKLVAQGQLTNPDLLTDAIKADKDRHRLDLVFVLPSLKANETATLKAVISDKKQEPFKYFHGRDADKSGVEWLFGDRPVMKYVSPTLDESSSQKREETFKVFHHVYDPSGKFLVTKGVGGQFTHHRGIFYGFMKATYGKNTVDIWHCKNDTHQAQAETRRHASGRVLASHRLEIDWNGVGKNTFARELRELTTYDVPGGTMIDFSSKLTPTGDDVKLDGDPQHAGFHFRASNEVAERQAAYDKATKIKDADKREEALKKIAVKDLTIFVRPDGDGKPGTETNWPANKKHVDLPWLAMSFVVKDKRFTVCYLDQPTNPKEARFSERAYGRFGSYFVTTVTKEKPLVVRYRLWLQEGKMKGDDVAALSKAFVEPVTVKLR
jgi:hypothetical protein